MAVPSSAKHILLGVGIGALLIGGGDLLYRAGQASRNVAQEDPGPHITGAVKGPPFNENVAQTAAAPAPPEPRVGWAAIKTFSVNFRPGSYVFLLELPPKSSLLRYKVESQYPVTVGYMNSEWRELVKQNQMSLAGAIGGSKCVEHGVSSRTVECYADAVPSTVVVYDERAPIVPGNEVIGKLVTGLIKNKFGLDLSAGSPPADAAGPANITIYAFGCVENCGDRFALPPGVQIVGETIATSQAKALNDECKAVYPTKEGTDACLRAKMDRLAPVY